MVAIIGSAGEMQLIVKGSIAQLAGKINTLSSTLVGVRKRNIDDKGEYRQCQASDLLWLAACRHWRMYPNHAGKGSQSKGGHRPVTLG